MLTSDFSNGLTAHTSGGNVIINFEGNVDASDAAIQGITGGANKSVVITSKGNLNANRGIIGEAANFGSTVWINSEGNIDGDGVAIQALASSNATIVSEGNINSNFTRGLHAQSFSGAAHSHLYR